MKAYILMPMPSESFLRRWEAGGLDGTLSSVDHGLVRDPAFLPREPNPVVRIRTEEGAILWRRQET